MNDRLEMTYGDSEKREPLHYTWGGLDNIYLCSGYEMLADGEGGHDVVIHDMDGLHDTIGEYLVWNKKALSGNEIRFLRKQMELSQAELADYIGTTDQSVARWEKAEFEIPGPAQLLLRCLYMASQDDDERVDLIALSKTIRELEGPVTDDKLFFAEANDGWFKKAA